MLHIHTSVRVLAATHNIKYNKCTNILIVIFRIFVLFYQITEIKIHFSPLFKDQHV